MLRGSRVERIHQIPNWHRADEVRAPEFLGSMRSLSDDMRNPTVLMENANNGSLHLDRVSVPVQLIGQCLPHLAGSALWVLEFVDEGFYIAGLPGQDCVANRG